MTNAAIYRFIRSYGVITVIVITVVFLMMGWYRGIDDVSPVECSLDSLHSGQLVTFKGQEMHIAEMEYWDSLGKAYIRLESSDEY